MIDVNSASQDRRFSAARIRQSVRRIDTQVARIRADDRLFQRCGFGSDVHDIQLSALQAERRELVAELGSLQSVTGPRSSRSGVMSWLLLPPALGAMLFQSFRPRVSRRPPPKA